LAEAVAPPGHLDDGRVGQEAVLEEATAVANDAQQILRFGGFRIADDGNLPRLREGLDQRLEPLPKPRRILGHHRLHLGQRLVGEVDLAKIIGEASELRQDGHRHRI
jgi:hypothetical protein